ncbi:cytochrome P450 [Nostoc sp. UIC 10630]|uniref:cytochrome P450 n=1 Tax=Nostoc sp. UIC 10630 TaxID=2100146 RepID=UPI0013D3BD31|nr:cytochrome P450 [Nostoc sp. UIC 10630]NEU82302.1 cytochrome P450 [Nostoc sp. UIC 10630]
MSSYINATKSSNIVTPPNASFESTLQALRQNPVPFITNLAQTYGDIVRLPFGSRDIYLLNRPDWIRQVYLGGSEIFAKRKDAAKEKSYINDIAPMIPLLQQDLIPTYAPAIVEAALKTDARWQNMYQQHQSPIVDIYREMMRLTVPIVSKTLFQEELETESAAIVDALLTMDVGYGFDTVAAILGDTVPPLEVSITPEMQAARSELLRIIHNLIVAQHTSLHSQSLLSALLQLQLSDEQVADIALKTFCAMHEVTVTTLSWTWYLLSQTPEVEAQLHTELANILAGHTPTFADVEKLTYTQMILNETRRLYPTVWLVGRFVRQDVSFGDNLIPSDSIVLVSQRVTHHDARYFPDPERFHPERWTSEVVATRPKFSFFPFSAGPRQCLGRDFAWIEDTLILATLAQHWQGKLLPNQVLEPHPQKSFAPRYGIKMTLHHR